VLDEDARHFLNRFWIPLRRMRRIVNRDCYEGMRTPPVTPRLRLIIFNASGTDQSPQPEAALPRVEFRNAWSFLRSCRLHFGLCDKFLLGRAVMHGEGDPIVGKAGGF
jgi:hypothetical protein